MNGAAGLTSRPQSLSFSLPLLAGIAAFLIFPFRFFVYTFLLLLIIISIIILAALYLKGPVFDEPNIKSKFPRLNFTRNDEWVREVEELESSGDGMIKKLGKETYNESLEQIVDYVIRDFIYSWFQSISPDQGFPNTVKSHINGAILMIEKRIATLDIPKLLVLKVLPLLNQHFQVFVSARDSVFDGLRNEGAILGVSELNVKIVHEFEQSTGLHDYLETAEDDIEQEIMVYSRDRVAKVLPLIFPVDELKSGVVETLLREILSQVVLVPLLNMLSDPDFWNKIIIQFATRTLKDRDQVRELKKVIDEQTSRRPKQQFGVSPNVILQNKISAKGRRISPQMKHQEFEKYLKSIDSSGSLSQLKQLRLVIALQINRTQNLNSTSDKFVKYCRRLNVAKDKIEARIAQLAEKTQSNESSTTSKRTSLVLFNQDNDLEEFIQNLSLFQVLTNPSALPFFADYMKQREREDLLKFWLVVNEIKDPLEDPRHQLEEDQSFDGEIFSSITEVDSKDFNEMKKIFNEFMTKAILEADPGIYQQVESYCCSDGMNVEEYLKVRHLIILLQLKVFKTIEMSDFKDFKNSDLFLKLLSNETFEESLICQVDNFETNDVGDLDFDSDNDVGQVDDGNQSMTEIENALTTILTKPDLSNEYPSRNAGTTTSTTKLKDELFGSEDNGFLDNKPLFQEDQQSIQEQAEEFQTLDVQNDFITPTHDAFNLKEEINGLGIEIDKLNKQSRVLDPIILKAELMNNSRELRLLRKSKASYQREIEAKELIRQQLIVQDNENSLFGKTHLGIKSWVKGRDENSARDYIVYLVEVEKENLGQVTNWVVGRRFNQFYKLNEYLRREHPDLLMNVFFPRKKIVLRFQEKAVIDERMVHLEKYLKALLEIPTICQDKEFRKFLTLEDYQQHLGQFPGLVSGGGSSASIPTFKEATNKLYNGIYSSLSLRPSNSDKRDSVMISQELDQLTDVEQHMESSFTSLNGPSISRTGTPPRESTPTSTPPPPPPPAHQAFIKPITDLFTSLFPLSNQTNNWLRGQAIVLILQQIFGSTIEKHVRSTILQFTDSNHVRDTIESLKDILWPHGIFMTRSSDRIEQSDRENRKLRIKNEQDSRHLMEVLMQDVFGKIVGVESCKVSGEKIHGMLQLRVLNLDLSLRILDAVLEEVFEEIRV